ncbi:DUF2177 family protein [Mangrovicoccus algicola]|uniref:DUF2177 family protein n=1 Tax=Mangrovicoccus algicola TaxID=2771008 RepID=A0A8J6Z2T2_9RHOB|nr:DUF2177 family protein [Mangrovicoccus algicola]MBE3640626.1 DUF2177 family protein [Mangrovicoccus algicola]
MQILTLYAATLILFLALDAIGITLIVKPVFDRHVGDLLADPLRLGPAVLFYLAYVAGILWFVSAPALSEGQPLRALAGGILLGLMCYGTYEFTNLATLRGWTWQQVAIDTAWGGALTGFSAWAGLAVTRMIHG